MASCDVDEPGDDVEGSPERDGEEGARTMS